MTLDIWAECRGEEAVMPIRGDFFRVVESQEQIATNLLVDNLHEQALLEHLLERSKPPLRTSEPRLHYLLSTPFRYPPLRHGSRFGNRYEPGIFYGACTLPVVLAETAYYRFVFWQGMSVPPPSGALTTEHTVFGAVYETGSGVRLHRPPFDRFAELLTHRDDYSHTQLLGTRMRDSGVLGFEFVSARDPGRGLNVGMFTAETFPGHQPAWQQSWLCETKSEVVTFFNPEAGTHTFECTAFYLDGRLPVPAL